VAERWAEFCVLREGNVLLSRPMTAGPTLAGEVRRNLAVYAGQTQQPIRAMYVAEAGEAAALRERLQQDLGIPVHGLDPFAGEQGPHLPNDNRGAFSGAVGLLHAQAAGKALPINFVAPKRPTVRRDPAKVRLGVFGGVAAALVLGLIGTGYYVLDQRDQEYKRLFQERTNLDRQIAAYEDDSKRAQFVNDKWAQTEVNWLDELHDVADRLPRDDSVRLVHLRGLPLTQTANDKHIARIEMLGIAARDFQVHQRLDQMFDDPGHYRVEPNKEVKLNTSLDSREYPQQFVARVDVKRQAPGQYTRKLQVFEPKRRPGRGGPGAPDQGDPDMPPEGQEMLEGGER
jgi:hypothetical protein